MADAVNTVPPVESNPVEGSNIPSKDDNASKGDNDFKINELIEKQMEAFKDTFISQFNKEYSDKLTKLENGNLELEEKKQRLIVSEELRNAGLEGDWIDFAYDKDLEICKMKIIQIKAMIKVEVDKGIQERLKTSYVPPTNYAGKFTQNNKDKPSYFVK